MGFPLMTQDQVRNSCGKRAIGVQATEVLLYLLTVKMIMIINGFFFNLPENMEHGNCTANSSILNGNTNTVELQWLEHLWDHEN